MIYEIQSGGQKWDQQAEDGLAAAVEAFKRAPPESPGQLTRLRAWDGKKRGRWAYLLTETVLRAAGMWEDDSPQPQSEKQP